MLPLEVQMSDGTSSLLSSLLGLSGTTELSEKSPAYRATPPQFLRRLRNHTFRELNFASTHRFNLRAQLYFSFRNLVLIRIIGIPNSGRIRERNMPTGRSMNPSTRFFDIFESYLIRNLVDEGGIMSENRTCLTSPFCKKK